MDYRLILMRHAKSSWKSDAPTDHERPLNKRGRRAAPKVAARLSELDWLPDHIVSSDSARTRETFARMRDTLEFDEDPDFRRDLYHAGTAALQVVLREVSPHVGTVLALGHNPGWEDALQRLTGEHHAMKTACAALLSRTASTWAEAIDGPGHWYLKTIIYPREL